MAVSINPIVFAKPVYPFIKAGIIILFVERALWIISDLQDHRVLVRKG